MAINAAAVFRVRPSGSNTNGGGYDASIGGAGTDYSQQNSAQASGSNGTAAGTTAFSDTTANAFTAAMIGNAIYIASGAGFTTGVYFVTGYTDSGHVTLDRSPGTGSAAVWKLGGGWADWWTRPSDSASIVPGNTVYILGSGIPNPSSYTYDYTSSSYYAFVSGNGTAGRISFLADPATPNYATGGRPVTKANGLLINNASYLYLEGLWVVASGTAAGAGFATSGNNRTWVNCVYDQFGYDESLDAGGDGNVYYRCEVFSSVAKRSSNSAPALGGASAYLGIANAIECNIHDVIGPGFSSNGNTSLVVGCVFANCGGVAIYLGNPGYGSSTLLYNTIVGGSSHGIEITSQGALASLVVVGNVIANNTGASKYGIVVDAGTTAANDLVRSQISHNWFYNNTGNTSALSTSSTTVNGRTIGDSIGTDPQFKSSSTEDYTPGANAQNWYSWLLMNHTSGKATPTSYRDPGAIQHQATGGTTVVIANPVQFILDGDGAYAS